MKTAPTFEECLDAAYAEHVRSWYDMHPIQAEAA